MRTRFAVIAAVVGLLLLAGAGGVYAYDRSHSEEIGKGVRVGGVDVSGLTPEQARAKLRTAVIEPLSRPVVVRARGKRYTLTAERAGVDVDIDGSVRAAMERTRDGSILSRTLRGLRGESLDAELELDIGYDRRAIARLVRRVGKAVDEPAVDASVDLEHGDVTPQESANGPPAARAEAQAPGPQAPARRGRLQDRARRDRGRRARRSRPPSWPRSTRRS